MRFTRLRRTGLAMGEENDRARQLFRVLIEQSHLHVWTGIWTVRPGTSSEYADRWVEMVMDFRSGQAVTVRALTFRNRFIDNGSCL